MKVFACLLAMTFSTALFADHRSHPEARTAQQLIDALNDLSYAADNEASRARDRRSAQEWSQISQSAYSLANQVGREVLAQLYHDSLGRAQRGFDNLDYRFRRLYSDLQSCGRVPFQVSSAENRVRRLQSRLGSELNSCGGGGGGGGGFGNWVCYASDRGWEEHFGGHEGRGRSRFDAERNAIQVCERFHGECRISRCSQR